MTFISILTFEEKQFEGGDVYTFKFSSKKKLDHKAGQHGVFFLPGFYRPHPFTLSSSPSEEYVSISTHTATGSRYKQKLMRMKPGDRVLLLGPILNFTYDTGENKHVFLAQGIGITPFRSMLVEAAARQLSVKTTLIHVDNKSHIFEAQTKRLATDAYYPANQVDFSEAVRKQDPSQVFYLSGSPRFVKTTGRLLLNMGVKRSGIKTDKFLGY